MSNLQTAYFAGGCFWCTEAVFKQLKGIEQVNSGYAGGTQDKPSYEEVSAGKTGHTETIEVKFDPTIILYEDLLNVFFTSHDPTTLNRQGNDVGDQYRSAIFYTDEDQKKQAEQYIAKLTKDKVFENPIVTELKPLEQFFPAEDYHHDYYNQNKNKPYCLLVINPKLDKIKKKFVNLIK
ncbi:peptide-methionine (S)-S-oxide reductase MsrA [Patescibacteria group bacterium]